MLKVRKELLDFADRSLQINDLDVLNGEFAAMADRQGFGSFILTNLPSVGDDMASLVISDHWPENWTERYLEQTYFPDDPVSQWSMSHTRPFGWREAWKAHPQTARIRQINGEAREHGLVDGIVFPLWSLRGCRAVLSFASDQPTNISQADVGLLYTASIFFHLRVTELTLLRKAPRPSLTAREREILCWTAGGKTAWDISQILSISEATVRNHLTAIRYKLNVTNTTHAVIVALKAGEIHL